MFRVEQCKSYKIVNEQGDFLHSDGTKLPRGEFWPTKEQAQAVLDKHQSGHVWVHGDVFRREAGVVMVYLVTHEMGPVVYLLGYSGPARGTIDVCLADATFLFNIKDKL